MNKKLLFALALLCCMLLSACSGGEKPRDLLALSANDAEAGPDISRYLHIIDDEPNTLDPQCTTEYYSVPLNVFDRLVEVETVGDESRLVPALAESWEISEDGRTYTFHLREDVRFSNGSPLTAEDVRFTMERLLTHPGSVNQDIALTIAGASALREGRADRLAGLTVLDDLTFSIELEYPFAPFLAVLSTPGASILDEESTRAAGDDFGSTIEATVGTGAFVLTDWEEGVQMLMAANPDHWRGMTQCEGLAMQFLNNTFSQQMLYEAGTLDILDLDYLGADAEYFIRGDRFRTNLVRGSRVGITYIALNEAVQPLNDARVRRALQLALDRRLLVKAVTSDRGNVENGIFPHGLLGYNPKLEEIPFDPEEAKRLLDEAGAGDGFDLEIYITDSANSNDRNQLEVIAAMWQKVGVRAEIVTVSSDEFFDLRKRGALPCYVATWSADYNDPDNFIYTFFGTAENSRSRSLCYGDEAVMRRILDARSIVDEQARIAEYQALERKIVQEDAAWVPLYSRQHLFVVRDRVKGFQVSWNGWSSNSYRGVSIVDSDGEGD